jgi:hypothetical protein
MAEKVKVKYQGKEYNINKSYLEGLHGYERRKQIKSIIENKDRPKVKGFKSQRSSHAKKFEDKYGVKVSDKDFIYKNLMSKKGVEEIMSKGRGAFFSSGSRPNQTAYSWALSRLASVLTGGNALKVDKSIAEEYGKPKWKKSMGI